MGIREASFGAVAGGTAGAASGVTAALVAGTAISGGALLPFALLGGGLGFLSGLLARKRQDQIANQRRELEPLREVGGPAQHVYGLARTRGKEIHRSQNGPNIDRAFLLSVGACESIDSVYIDNKHVAVKEGSRIVTRIPPGVVGRGKNLNTVPYNPISGNNYRIDFAIDCDSNRFETEPANAQLIRMVWGQFAPASDPPRLFFRATGFGGSGPGPHLKTPGNYSVLLRFGARVERFPLPDQGREPYTLDATTAQLFWLSDFGRRGESFDIALIDETEWLDSVDYSEAFNDRYREGTGELVPDSDIFERGDRDRILFKIYPYFRADGTGGDSLREATVQAEEEQASQDGEEAIPGTPMQPESRREPVSLWTTDHKVLGNSWCHVQLRQVDNLWPDGLPDFEFVMKGKKLRWPGQRRAMWTDNLAAIWYDILTTIRMDNDLEQIAKIDVDSFVNAFALAEEEIVYRLPESLVEDGYSETSKRYTAGFVWREDEDLDQLERELGFAGIGQVSKEDDSFVFQLGPGHLPGGSPPREPPAILLTERNCAGWELSGPAERSRPIAGVKASLGQSKDHHYQTTAMRPARIVGAPGDILDTGVRAVINDPLHLGRVMTMALRRELASQRLTWELIPDEHFQVYGLRVGMTARVKHDAIRAKGEIWVIEQIAPSGDDGRLTLLLSPDLDWEDGFVAPPPKTAPRVRSDGVEVEDPDVIDGGSRFEIRI